ncbi:putative dipeptidyl-aminopeptidase B [Scedosporium apiospermum]|uniref:Probable dipeptidyl-aminopeptidase B n=1 Tax=Pseudallescheria apiosperma TaxID=563466 RepID=A0A084GGA3_PSEDA|nr:putative dipeptidyl-aminopeptidase B [Scedosporium apiospermum]KEZ46365.1 putative dipeptidyl-aminopeptidase B [Scedosporium apiospermum]
MAPRDSPPSSTSKLEDPYDSRSSEETLSSVSTTSLVFERIEQRLNEKLAYEAASRRPYDDDPLRDDPQDDDPDGDLETARFLAPGARIQTRGMDKRWCRAIGALAAILTTAWFVALFAFLSAGRSKAAGAGVIEPDGAAIGLKPATGNPVTLEQVLGYEWAPASHSISWVPGPDNEDGLLLQQGAAGKDYLVVEDIRTLKGGDDSVKDSTKAEDPSIAASRTLIKSSSLKYGDDFIHPEKVWPSRNLKKVLIATRTKSVWRHSFSAVYYILDVETQELEPLDPLDVTSVVRFAIWSPQSDAIAFTKDNNLYLRTLDARGSNKKVRQITRDGGPNVFYGIPDWVFEEEIFGSNQGTWWSDDGKFIAVFRANETEVPEYPVDFFIEPPVDQKSEDDMLYPKTEWLKYPKAGAPNPVVDVQFYDVDASEVFTVNVDGGFDEADRLVTNVLWAGDKVIIKETNRISDVLRVVLIDPKARAGKTVRTVDVKDIDGGWFERSEPKYIPADPANGRPEAGYVDTVLAGFGDHLAYFTPLDNPEPKILTSGDWEVVNAPSAIDLANNLVYFVSTKESSIQRHVYSVKLDGTDLTPVTNVTEEAYYGVSFSSGAGYALLNYQGPSVPWHKVVSTPSNNPDDPPYEHVLETNEKLRRMVKTYDVPALRYGTVEVDGVHLNYVERLPPNFNPARKYPVLFFQYSGPGSQQVNKRFSVNYQSFVASSLGYVVVTVDGRGTGFIGRKARVLIRGNLGRWESHDQIAAGKHWAAKPYIDPSRLAIWGWSFGGFNTLKTLEVDAGETFSYGVAVAPVTDWRLYDSIYTERYMRTPQENPEGYAATAISNASALAGPTDGSGGIVRFMIMHGTADDNVHVQNTLKLLDELDLAGARNYDVHVYPDSNHGIYFHKANSALYHRLTDWLINAFNGEWVRLRNPKPKQEAKKRKIERDEVKN